MNEGRQTTDDGRPRAIRVVRESGGIGDIVRIIPALRGLREKYPGAALWVFAPEEYRPLLRGWFDEFRPTPAGGRRPRDVAVDEKRWPYLNVGTKFDLSINLYCPAFRHERERRGEVWLDRIDLFCQAAGVEPVVKTPVVNLLDADVAAAREHVHANALKERGRLVALQPFSTDPARNWPVESWRQLAREIEEMGPRVVILDGCDGRTREFPQHRVVGKPLGFVAALLRECDLLVAPDSGLGHLAAAVGTPAVGLFASQSGPIIYRHYPLHTYIYPAWDRQALCRWPCFWARRPECTRNAMQPNGRTCPMLARITVGDVLSAVRARCGAGYQPATRTGSPRHTPVPGVRVPLPAMSAAARRAVAHIERIRALPIPHRDHSVGRLVLADAAEDLSPVLREAFRVLAPGGKLFVAAAITDAGSLVAAHGFRFSRNPPHPEVAELRKTGTWPQVTND